MRCESSPSEYQLCAKLNTRYYFGSWEGLAFLTRKHNTALGKQLQERWKVGENTTTNEARAPHVPRPRLPEIPVLARKGEAVGNEKQDIFC